MDLGNLPRIESPRNSRLKIAFSLRLSRRRRQTGLSLLEGGRFVRDCVRLRAPVVELFLDEALSAPPERSLLEEAARQGIRCYRVASGVLGKLSEHATLDGMVATVRIPRIEIDELSGRSPLVLCHEIQNPGNMGAIIRVAAAFGAGGVIAEGGSDPFGPKALRGAAGATFRVPVTRWTGRLEGLLELLSGWSYSVLAAMPRGGVSHRRLRLSNRLVALLLGSEGRGFEDAQLPELLEIQAVSIGLRGQVESLNVAVAAGILLDRFS